MKENNKVTRPDTVVRNTTHGGSHLNCFSNWGAMIRRCYNPNSDCYAKYGGSGIRVCEFLRATPFNLILSIGTKPTPKHSIDRFPKKDGHYACGACSECCRLGLEKNVRWATDAEQMRNTARNRLYTIDGVTKCLLDWAVEKGIKISTANGRVRRGLNPFDGTRPPPGSIYANGRKWLLAVRKFKNKTAIP